MRKKVTRTQTNQALRLIPRIPRPPTVLERRAATAPVGGCFVCGAPLRRALDQGEAYCTNPVCRKYVPEGA